MKLVIGIFPPPMGKRVGEGRVLARAHLTGVAVKSHRPVLVVPKDAVPNGG